MGKDIVLCSSIGVSAYCTRSRGLYMLRWMQVVSATRQTALTVNIFGHADPAALSKEHPGMVQDLFSGRETT